MTDHYDTRPDPMARAAMVAAQTFEQAIAAAGQRFEQTRLIADADMLRFAGRDADRARELLELLDRTESGEYDEDRAVEHVMEKSGNQTLDTLDAIAAEVEMVMDLRFWGKFDATFKEFGDLNEQTLETFARAYDKHEAQSFALHALMVEAGRLNQNDYTTDPLTILRMFLPVD